MKTKPSQQTQVFAITSEKNPSRTESSPPTRERKRQKVQQNRQQRRSQRSNVQRKCRRCDEDHAFGACPLYDGKCFKCGQPGHIAKFCPKKSTRDLVVAD